MTKPINPLRRLTIEDIGARSFDPQTQSSYIRAVKKLTAFLGHSPDTADAAGPARGGAPSRWRAPRRTGCG